MKYYGGKFLVKPPSFKQQGLALLLLVVIILLAGTAFFISSLSSPDMKNQREAKTQQALSEAKQALLAYSVHSLGTEECGTNCPRPGDLPCPDLDDDGVAGKALQPPSCGNANGTTGQSDRLGRLPWKTLGLDDLRDGSGERLWYAVSNQYKNNTRRLPLNSDSTGTISLRNANGTLVNDGSSTTGLVAIVIAAGAPITRDDGVSQARDSSQKNIESNYLDIALSEDNAAFVDSTTDGFISGPIRNASGQEILNDRLLGITREEMAAVMEARVLSEIMSALLTHFCETANNVSFTTRSCKTPVATAYFPSPALFSNASCLNSASLNGCGTHVADNKGRIPANFTWNPASTWLGTSSENWFQQNGWRELIYYAVAPACTLTTPNCSGSGYLTLNNALTLPTNNKRVVLIASGSTLSAQSRNNVANKILVSNYLEDENVSPLDDIYSRLQPFDATRNDRALSIP